MSRRNDGGQKSEGFLSTIKHSFIPERFPAPASQSQPSTSSSSGDSYLPNPSALLVDLAPNLLSSSTRLLHPKNVTAHQASLTASSSRNPSSSSGDAVSLRRKLEYLRAGLSIGRPNAPIGSWTELSTQLYLRDRVDDLLRLPVPAAPFPLSTTTHSSSTTGAVAAIEAPPPRPDDPVPLYQGFRATIPAAAASKAERRRRRALLSEKALGIEGGAKLGLRERGEKARGLLLNGEDGTGEFGELKGEADGEGEDGLHIGLRSKGRSSKGGRKGKKAHGAGEDDLLALESRDDLEKDAKEVEGDMANVAVRRALVNGQMRELEEKIRGLEKAREELRRGLLGLREEELELEDELEGIQARLARLPLNTSSATPSSSSAAGTAPAASRDRSNSLLTAQSSRRRKGPAFLPSEHDELPTGVAFMTLHGHLAPLLSLDITEPYGTLVSSSSDASVRLWDLTTGTETGFLKGHRGVVKTLQVEGNVCVTGGEEGGIRVWDLDKAEEMFYTGVVPQTAPLAAAPVEEDVFGPVGTASGAGLVNGASNVPLPAEDDGLMREQPTSVRDGAVGVEDGDGTGLLGELGGKKEQAEGPCMRVLDGHTKAVTSLYFDGGCLVTGSSDSTLRQWDLTTGQCVQTMDILWAISNPLPTSSVLYPASSYSPSSSDPFSTAFSTHSPPTTPRKAASLRRQSSLFESPGAMAAPTTASYADGSWEVYDDFVGSVMFWGYALASGTKDGCVRMWDMRTGQAHRTLVGHTGPVTTLQFDEYNLISGSLDRSVRIWDLRTGAIADTIRYDHAVTALQFDSRKIVAAAGENGVKVYNRTTMQHSTLQINGHTSPVERLRFMDRYLATGGRDATVKIWALQ
ncbi:hypothetical protein JCM6882_001293 [Rhodosporidiobolus microsporus]